MDDEKNEEQGPKPEGPDSNVIPSPEQYEKELKHLDDALKEILKLVAMIEQIDQALERAKLKGKASLN